MHILLALLCVVVLALIVSVTVLCRRVSRLGRRLEDAEDRLSLAEWAAEDALVSDHGHRVVIHERLAKIERAAPCRRRHAEDFESLLRRPAPIPQPGWRDDEELSNPLMP